MPRLLKFFLTLLAAITLAFGSQAANEVKAQTYAYTFTVTSSADQIDYAQNGACNTVITTGGPCTLRAAIMEANNLVSTGNVLIKLPPGTYPITIIDDPYNAEQIKHGDLDITGTSPTYSITVMGESGATAPVIDGAGSFDRAFEVANGSTLNLVNLNIQNFGVLVGYLNFDGGGAIYNKGNLNLQNIRFISNLVECAPGISSSACSGYERGGAILNIGGLVNGRDLNFYGNLSREGSAIHNFGASSRIFLHNTAILFNQSDSYTIINGGTMKLVNATMAGNYLSDGSGLAGIMNLEKLAVASSTLVNHVGGPLLSNAGQVTIQDTILASFGTQPGYATSNCNAYGSPSWISGGYNISNDSSCPFNSPGDLNSIDPRFDTGGTGIGLAYFKLLPDSPAINHRPANCSFEGGVIRSDLLGVPRGDGRCDSGAFERNFPIYMPVVVRN